MSAPWKKRLLLERLFLFVCALGLTRFFWSAQPFGDLHDDAIYILTALGWLGEPLETVPRARSLGPSLMVLPYLAIWPDNLAQIRWVPTGLSIVFLLLFHEFTRKTLGPKLGLPMTLLVLLSPGFLTVGCNVMAEPILNLSIWIALSLLASSLDKAWKKGLFGLALIGALLSRPEGFAFVGAALMALAAPRIRLSPKSMTAGALICLAGILWLTSDGGPATPVKNIANYFREIDSIPQYFARWTTSFLNIVGADYVLAASSASPEHGWPFLIGLTLVVAAFAGCFRSENKGAGLFLKLTLLFILGATSLWPLPGRRYFFSLWPLLIVLSTLALPKRFRLGWIAIGLLATGSLALPNLYQAKLRGAEREETQNLTMEWLRDNSQPDTGLISEFPAKYLLRTKRRVLGFNDHSGFPEIMLYAAQEPDVLVIFGQVGLLKDVFGVQYYYGMNRLQPWLETSSHATLELRNKTDLVYRLKGSPELRQSMQKYQAAVAMDWSNRVQREQADQLLRESMELCPDLPFVASNLAILKLSSGEVDEGTRLLEDVLRKYHFDLNSIYNLALADINNGNRKRGLQLLEEGIKKGVELGEQTQTQKLRELLHRTRNQ